MIHEVPDLVLPSPVLSCQHESLVASSREEAQALRVQLEEQRERARREMQEAQRHGSSAQSELDRSHMNLRRLEEEVRVHCLRGHTLSLVVPFFQPSHHMHVTLFKPVCEMHLCEITCKKKQRHRISTASRNLT